MELDIQAIRARFPALQQAADSGAPPVFFDNPAGTQVPADVIQAVGDYFTRMNANSGGVFATSQRSDTMVRDVRRKVADFLNAPSSDEIVFGANSTTLNFALSRALGHRMSSGDELVVTRMDHDANVAPWLRLAQDRGLEIKWVDINTADGTLDLDTLEAALSEKTRLVATVHASNALGTINPVARIAGMVHAAGALHIVDAVQSAPHVPLDVQALGCDFLFCSSYKFYGPHLGILWGRAELLSSLPAYKVRPSKDVIPYRWETGTPAFELISGLGATMDYLASFGQGAEGPSSGELATYSGRVLNFKRAMLRLQHYERDLVSALIDTLKSIPGVHIFGITDPARYDERVPTVIFTMDGHTPKEIAEHLAQNDIYVWDGDYYALEVMGRLGHPDGMVRVGLAHYNTPDEIDRLGAALRAL